MTRSFEALAARAACCTLLSTACVSQTESGEAAAVESTPASKTASGAGMKVSVARSAGTVEVRVEAAEPFGPGAMPPVLVIGDVAFGRSKNPPDGKPNVVIFLIDAAEYAALPAGAEVSVGILRSSARLVPGEPASGSLPAKGPRIHPSQVEGKQRLGVLQKGGEVLP